MSNASLTLWILYDTGSVHNWMTKAFLPQTWKDCVKSFKLPQFRAIDREVLSIEPFLPLFTPIGDLRLHAWFGIVENLIADLLLETSFIDGLIRRIFSNEQK